MEKYYSRVPKFAHVEPEHLLPNSDNDHVHIAFNVLVEPDAPIDVDVLPAAISVLVESDAPINVDVLPVALNVLLEPGAPIDVDVPKESSPIVIEEDALLEDVHMPKELLSLSVKRCNPSGDAEGPSSSRIKRTMLNRDESFDLGSLEADPGLRRPISEYPLHEQDNIRRAYLSKGPCQPNDGFPLRSFGDKQRRKFGVEWYTEFGRWIEYSTSKDAAFCLYCYLFKKGGGADNFVVTGFRNWKKKEKIQKHQGKAGSAHHKAYMLGRNLLNQNQSIVAALVKQTDQQREDYKDRLEASIKVVRLLLELGLPFRGHDKSIDSMKKGKFHTCLRFLTENNENVRDVLKSAPKNGKMTAPLIQKDIVQACALETVEAIRRDIGDACFALLVDESRDVSIKEQMVVAVRYVDKMGHVIVHS